MALKNAAISGISLFLGLSLGFALALPAQQSQPDQEKMMEAFMKHMAVTENHAFLKDFAGAWEVTSTAWMQPGAEPTVSKNPAAAELIMGGRFLKMEYKGTMFGQPFEGLQIVGYDNMKQKYISFWIDNSSTSFFLTEGSRDASGKVVTDMGLWPDPMTGGASKVKAITRWVSADEFTYELYMIGADGKEFKSLENRAVRKR